MTIWWTFYWSQMYWFFVACSLSFIYVGHSTWYWRWQVCTFHRWQTELRIILQQMHSLGRKPCFCLLPMLHMHLARVIASFHSDICHFTWRCLIFRQTTGFLYLVTDCCQLVTNSRWHLAKFEKLPGIKKHLY